MKSYLKSEIARAAGVSYRTFQCYTKDTTPATRGGRVDLPAVWNR